MRVIKPPEPLPDNVDLFLSGSMEALLWQDRVVARLEYLRTILPHATDVVIANPRRDDWDNTWTSRPFFAPFREQVTWELDGLERARLVAVYFAPETKAPITLLELGLCASKHADVIVCCPVEYWKVGNVEMVSMRYGMQFYDHFDNFVERISMELWGSTLVA